MTTTMVMTMANHHMEQKNKGIADKLFAIQKEGLKVKKDGINPHFKNKYTTLDNLVETILPLCTKQKVLVSHYGAHGFWHTKVTDTESGETEVSSFPLPEGVDAQKMGSAITYAKRYNLASIFNIVSDEDDDGNNAVAKQGDDLPF